MYVNPEVLNFMYVCTLIVLAEVATMAIFGGIRLVCRSK